MFVGELSTTVNNKLYDDRQSWPAAAHRQGRAEEAPNALPVAHNPGQGHRAPVHRVLQQALREGHLHLRRVRAGALLLGAQVRQRVRLAGLQRRRRPGPSHPQEGHDLEHGQDRGRLLQLQLTPGTRVQRRPQAYPEAILHKLDESQLPRGRGAEEGVEPRSERASKRGRDLILRFLTPSDLDSCTA